MSLLWNWLSWCQQHLSVIAIWQEQEIGVCNSNESCSLVGSTRAGDRRSLHTHFAEVDRVLG